MTEYLFHYTNLQGLLGILKSNCLWLTDASKSNDESELRIALDIINEIFKINLKDEKTAIHICNIIAKITGIVKNTNIKPVTEGIFTLSFSMAKDDGEPYFTESNFTARNGLLSQWRGYGNYAIKFKKEKISDLRNKIQKDYICFDEVRYYPAATLHYIEKFKNDFRFLRIPSELYSNKNLETESFALLTGETLELTKIDRITLWEEACAIILKKPIWIDFFKETPQQELSLFFDTLIYSIVFCKNWGFYEEKESRFCFIKNQSSEKEIKLNNQKKYVDFFHGQIVNCIEEIIIGPSEDKSTKEIELKEELKKLKLNIKTKVSQIPYIDN